MNKRSTEIVQLLDKEKEEITVSGFAEYFQVSQKTIRNDLKEINSILRENHREEVMIQKGGRITVPFRFRESMPLLLEGDFYDYKLSKEERVRIAAAMIVNASDYITLATIADNLFVSRATVINELKEIKAYVREQGLEVGSYANKGLRAEGQESLKRAFLLNVIRAEQADPGGQKNMVGKFVSVQSGDYKIIQKILAEQAQRYKKHLDDQSFQEIVLFLRIMINRNRSGEFLEPIEDLESENYMFALDILRTISQYCDVTTTEEDVKSLTGHIDRVRCRDENNINRNTLITQMITRTFIAEISSALGINLNSDYDFFENLSNHLESVFSAPPMDYQDEETVDEALRSNQDVLEAVIEKLPLLYQYTDRELTRIEIKYIAVHVCAAIERKRNKEVPFRVIVACHAGIGTSKLLLEKLKRYFKFRVVDVIAAHQASLIDPDAADFVISTVPLENCPLEYDVVSAAFSDTDYIRIGSRIDSLRSNRNLPGAKEVERVGTRGLMEKITPLALEMIEPEEQAQKFLESLQNILRSFFNQSQEEEEDIISPSLHHLLTASNIEVDVECADWREAIRKAGEKMVDGGYIEPRYIDAMITSIEKYGPYVVLSQGFAMPHAKVEEGSIRLGMFLIRLKEPVAFGVEELDPIEFVCCLSAVDHKSYLKAFFNLVAMFQDNFWRKQLEKAQSADEITHIILRFEHGEQPSYD